MSEAQAQNKLGELFVDLGVGGLGKTLKALNSVSASFLMTKNAAQQAIKPIADMTKQGMTFSTALDKIKASTGFTEELSQKIKAFSTKNNIEFNGFISSLEALQQEILAFQKGTSTNGAWATLGINPAELDFEKPLEALDLIQSRLKQLKEPARISAINDLGGISKDIAYLVQRVNEPISQAINNIDKGLILSKEQLEVLKKQQDHWNNISVATDKIKNNIASMEISERFMNDVDKTLTLIAAKGYIEGGAEATEKFDERNKGKQAQHRQAFIDFITGKKNNAILKYDPNELREKGFKEGQFEQIRQQVYKDTQKLLEEEGRKYWNSQSGTNTDVPGVKQINSPKELSDDYVPPLPKEAPLNNNNIKTININNTLTNNFDGTTASPSEIASEITSQIAQFSTVEKENPSIN